jgi:large subunit ribosomal protein L6
MSRIGKQILKIPAGVDFNLNGGTVTVKGPKGTLTRSFKDNVEIVVSGDSVTFVPRRNDRLSQALWGTYASEVKSMLQGVVTPFEKKLLIEGVGFKWDVKGKDLHLMLGFSHPIVLAIPEGVTVAADKSSLTVTGPNKEEVGLFANKVRSLKKPEPYKGKGIRYSTETILRKQGKKTA